MLGSKSKKKVSPMYWKSGVSILMNDDTTLRVFSDSRPLLESVGSTNQIGEKAMELI